MMNSKNEYDVIDMSEQVFSATINSYIRHWGSDMLYWFRLKPHFLSVIRHFWSCDSYPICTTHVLYEHLNALTNNEN